MSHFLSLMKRVPHLCLRQVLSVMLLLACPVGAQTATQNLTLSAGWHAVWLEVEPLYESGPNAGLPQAPQDVFSNIAIEVVAIGRGTAGEAGIGCLHQDDLVGSDARLEHAPLLDE